MWLPVFICLTEWITMHHSSKTIILVHCCSPNHHDTQRWTVLTPRPRHIAIFRSDKPRSLGWRILSLWLVAITGTLTNRRYHIHPTWIELIFEVLCACKTMLSIWLLCLSHMSQIGARRLKMWSFADTCYFLNLYNLMALVLLGLAISQLRSQIDR